MNTLLSRANTIFAFTLSVLAALTFGCFLTTAFNDHKKEVAIESTKAIVLVVYIITYVRLFTSPGFQTKPRNDYIFYRATHEIVLTRIYFYGSYLKYVSYARLQFLKLTLI